MKYRLVNAPINSINNASTSCENLVNIGPVTSEFKRAKTKIFEQLGKYRAKIGISRQISQHKFLQFVKKLRRVTKLTFIM